ncbi:MAG TPA: alpha-L-fucosidase, partial [Gemmatimonadales bacterium]|nr:alpha-L-fucosidase [Gemmatimonadales bacterium]
MAAASVLARPRGVAGSAAGFASRKPALPTPQQVAWQDLELGMFVHLAPNTWTDKEYDDLSLSPEDVVTNIDAEQWADVALSLGAKYVVLVAKHAGGYCLWQTDTTDYSIKNSPWKGGRGDAMADLSHACKERGLGLGVYLSPRDDKHGAGVSGRCKTPEAQAAYNAIYREQLTEVLGRYGPIVELWLDGNSVVPTGDIVAKLQPGAMVFQGPQATIRWVGNEDGFAPYPCWNSLSVEDALDGSATALEGDPDGEVWRPVEADVSVRRPDWFWSTTNEKDLLSLDALVEIYYRSVGHGTQLLVNFPPDRSGRIPAADAARAREFGDLIRHRFGSPVAEVAGRGKKLTVEFGVERRVDHVVLQEDISQGERVRTYEIEARIDGKWRVIGAGTAIGHKRIQPIGGVVADALRLQVHHSDGKPQVRRFAVYNTGAEPPTTWNTQPELTGDDVIGGWTGDRFEVDLTPHIDRAAQYRVRFAGIHGEPVEVQWIELLEGGDSAPQLIHREKKRKDA